jgi:putative flippase GtrA
MTGRLATLLPSRFLRFALSGGIAAGANILSRIAFSHALPYEAAVVAAFLVAMTVGFLLMKLFVFGRSGQSSAREYLRFGAVNLGALAQVWIVSVALARWLFPLVGFFWLADTVAHVIGVASPIVTSYFAHKHFTFRRASGSTARS